MVKIYIVEDNEELQKLYVLNLTNNGHTIIGQSYNGEEALIDLYFNYGTNTPDILILDYNIPGKNGLELFNDLNNLGLLTNTSTLLISANKDLETQALEIGITRYINKPFYFKKLNEIISELIRIKINFP